MWHHLIISARDYKSAFSPILYILSHCQNFQYSLYYYQHAGVSHHTAEMIWDIVALPPRCHQRHQSCASFRCRYLFIFGLIFTAFSVVLAYECRSGMIRVRGSDGRMKAVRHFDRLQGGFIGTCTSNSPYSGTTYELCIISSLISPCGTDVQLVTWVTAAKCSDRSAEVSFYRQN